MRLTWQAQLLRDAGRGDEAVAGFEETLQADKAYVQVRGEDIQMFSWQMQGR